VHKLAYAVSQDIYRLRAETVKIDGYLAAVNYDHEPAKRFSVSHYYSLSPCSIFLSWYS
jgi:hypothetical protein